jgi:hypothetical protein
MLQSTWLGHLNSSLLMTDIKLTGRHLCVIITNTVSGYAKFVIYDVIVSSRHHFHNYIIYLEKYMPDV